MHQLIGVQIAFHEPSDLTGMDKGDRSRRGCGAIGYIDQPEWSRYQCLARAQDACICGGGADQDRNDKQSGL